MATPAPAPAPAPAPVNNQSTRVGLKYFKFSQDDVDLMGRHLENSNTETVSAAVVYEIVDIINGRRDGSQRSHQKYVSRAQVKVKCCYIQNEN